MKKITLLALALFTIAIAQAQQELDFKVEYKPKTTYTSETTTSGTLTINFTGEGAAEMMESQGMENPMKQDVTNYVKVNLVTDVIKGNTLPFVMNVFPTEKTEIHMPNGAVIYGKKQVGQVPVFDSIVAKGSSAVFKDAMFAAMKETITNAFPPAAKVKTGGSFVQEVPLKIPMGPVELKMTNKITFTLKKIDGNKAYFDTVSIMTANIDVQGQNMGGKGSGTGTMVYDIAKQYILEQQDNSTLNMNMEMDGISMGMEVKSLTVIKNIITPNN